MIEQVEIPILEGLEVAPDPVQAPSPALQEEALVPPADNSLPTRSHRKNFSTCSLVAAEVLVSSTQFSGCFFIRSRLKMLTCWHKSGGGGGGTFFDMGGGPGIRIHHFGGPNPRRRPAAGQQDAEADTSISSTIIRLLPLILIFVFSLLSSFISGGSESSGVSGGYRGPSIKFKAADPYTSRRLTPNYKIPFYVNPSEIANQSPSRLNQMDKYAESTYLKGLQHECQREYDSKSQQIQESQGWFFVDQKKFQAAMNIQLPSCDRLRELGVAERRLY